MIFSSDLGNGPHITELFEFHFAFESPCIRARLSMHLLHLLF